MRVRKGWLLGLGLLGLAGAIAWPRNRTELAILDSPINLEVVRLEDVNVKPVVDITLPVFGQFTLPHAPTLPNEAKYATAFKPTNGALAGYLFDPSNLHATGTVDSDFNTWKTDGITITDPHRYSEESIACPRVFGFVPRTVSLTPAKFFRGKPCTVILRLPALGVPEPALPAFTANAGNWVVSLKPLPWLAPLLPMRYALSVSDEAGSSFLVQLNTPGAGTGMTNRVLRCSPGRSAIIHVEDFVIDGKLPLLIYRIDEKPVRLKPVFETVGRSTFLKLIGNDSKVFASDIELTPFLAQEIKGVLIAFTCNEAFSGYCWPPGGDDYFAGQRIAGGSVNPFNIAEKRPMRIDIPLPELLRYR